MVTLLKLKPKKTDFGDKQAKAELSLVLKLKKKKTRRHFSQYRRVILVIWLNSAWSVNCRTLNLPAYGQVL